MKIVLGAILILALAGCSAEEKQKRGGKHTEAERAAALAAMEARKGPADAAVPETVPASYAVFPLEVRSEIYRWDLLNQKCGGRFRKGEAACEEADKLSQTLLAKGWCYGGSDDPANAHWVLCAQDYPGGEGWIAGPGKASTDDQ
jgi:hypothetical protein